jgi:hypothetical protein
LPIDIEQKISVANESVVDFVLDDIAEINRQINEKQLIMDAFNRCGSNPWSKEKA